ncbi:MAG: UvrD-helicase domain-containing protein [Endomicrobium sp.]|jgi:hypothetical protein|nr:UvrD-helicase domain-containing protein [Endomicrobium sp.]
MTPLKELISITDNDIDSLLAIYNDKYPHESKHFCALRKSIIKNLDTKDFHAVAGSGKTTLLAFKIALLLNKWPYKNQGICVLSHTNVAKDIIIKELKNINPHYSLETYPNFIGTIQQFVDSYLSIPYIDSCVSKVKYIDSEQYWNRFKSMFGFWETPPLKVRFKSLSSFVKYLKENNSEKYCSFMGLVNPVPRQKAISFFNSKKALVSEIESVLLSEGIFTYEDMFKYAYKFIEKYPNILVVLRYKFPLIIVDEAQDTSEKQYEILEKCFANIEKVVYQRIGDPDQAIYDFGGDADLNDKNFSRCEGKEKITESHRFCKKIAEKTTLFSLSSTTITSNIQGNEIFEINFNQSTPSKAIEEFVNHICSNKDRLPVNPIVKIIGAQGNNSSARALDIQAYIPAFNKELKKRRFRTSNIFQALEYLHKNILGNFANNYDLIMDCIARSSVINAKRSSRLEFITFLTATSQLGVLNRLILTWLYVYTPISKEKIKEDFSQLCDITFNYEVLCDSKYKEENFQIVSYIDINNEQIPVINNSFKYNELTFHIDTIHGVKGETHDATLVLATKDGTTSTDIQTLRAKTKKNNHKAQWKKLYVAMSRPKHILAIAIPR